MSDIDDRRLDAEYDRYMDNRTDAEIYQDELEDLEYEIDEICSSHPNISNYDIIGILENEIEHLRKIKLYNNQSNRGMFRIDEAIGRAKANGKRVLKKELAAKLWPDSSEAAQQVNMTALCTGRKQKIAPEWVETICQETGVSADFLFGLTND